MTVHNHGTEDGPGLACQESRINGKLKGKCMNARTIPEAAITAAWEALVDSRDHLRSPTRSDLKDALEAAAPHLFA